MRFQPQAVIGGSSPVPCAKGFHPLDSNSGYLLILKIQLAFRCCAEERGRLTWCRGASGPAAKPPTRMLCIWGKPGNHPQGKVYFPLRMFPGFLGPEALKLFVTPAQQAELVCLFQLRYFADCGSRVLSTLVGVWGEQPQRSLLV